MDDDICEDIVNIEKCLRKMDYVIRKKGREILSDFDITVAQFSALQILIHNKTLTISELSKKMSLACSTITDLVDRMEKSKLVVRKKDEKDKRVVKVEVLPKGYDILEKVLKRRIEFLSSKLIGFNKEEKYNLNINLKSLYKAMEDEGY